MSHFLYGVIAAGYSTVAPAPPPPEPPPTPPPTPNTCEPYCNPTTYSAYSYTAWSYSAWSACSGGTRTRTGTRTGTRTATTFCVLSDCATSTDSFTQTTTEETTESESCGVTWYCSTSSGGRYTSSTDDSGFVECVSATSCSTGGYPGNPQVPC
jgi:hypothetical protein